MSEAGKAVFLSYASQDAAAVQRICEALRATGVEVWFDQNELVGGDAWDAKIRKQIAECALFVPIISANTQARLEGYFRIEWKLAARRTYAIASAKAFLLPVVIDDTRDAAAHVPDEFREVQWTRLPGGEPTPKFCAHVQRLLAPTPGEGGTLFEKRPAAPATAAPVRRSGFSRTVGLAAGLMLAAALIVAGIFWPRRGPDAPVRGTAARVEPTSRSEAQRLVQQAQDLLARSDELNRQNLHLAEELVTRALALEPANPDAVLLSAQIAGSFVWYLFDNSMARRQQLQQQAARALALRPDSTAARLAQVNAQATLFFNYAETPVAFDLEKEARALVALEPHNWRMRRALGSVLRTLNRREEMLTEMRAAFEMSQGNSDAAADLINVLVRGGYYAEAEVVRARAMAGAPTARLLCWDVMLKLRWHSAPAAAVEAVKSWPGWLVQEDRGLFHRWQAFYWNRQPVDAERLARMAVRDMVKDFSFYGPAAVLRALANEMAGNREAARADWRIALEKAERELQTEADNEPALYWKAWALARLGRTEEAKTIAALLAQRGRGTAFAKVTYLEALQVAVGDKAAAFAGLRSRLAAPDDSLGVTRAVLELDPAYDSVRSDPEFQAILREAPAPAAAAGTAPTAAPGGGEKSVAVLAFKNLSGDPARDVLADGISEAVTEVLGRVPGLKVTASASAFSFKGKNVAAPEIARQLGVTHLVEGTVLPEGTHVRITAKLIQADGFQVWVSDKLDRELKNIFALHDEVAGLIAKNLSLKLGGTSAAARATVNPEAFELYIKARQEWNQRNVPAYRRAEELLRRALALEPKFARAHAALADVWGFLAGDGGEIGTFGRRDSPEFSRLRAQVDRALELDPDLAEAHATLGNLFLQQGRTEEAVQALRRAVALNPNYATGQQWLGRALQSSGRFDEAREALARAAALDPFSHRILDNYASMLQQEGRHSEALALMERALALQPDAVQATMWKALSLSALGRHDEAVALVRGRLYDDTPYVAEALKVLVAAGRKEEARQMLERNPNTDRFRALVALGRPTEALGAVKLETMNIGSFSLAFIDPAFDPIREDPRYVALIAELGLTEAHARARAWRKAHPLEVGGKTTEDRGRKTEIGGQTTGAKK